MDPKGTLQLPPAVSTVAPEVDWTYYFIYWLSVVLFAGIVFAMLLFVWRYRRKKNPKPEPTGHNNQLELFWTFTPLLALVMMFHWGFKGYIDTIVAPKGALEIRVRAKQWLWDFQYPNGNREVGTLRVPVNRPVKLIMSSDDVLHSFFVPAFRVKRDAVPGMYTTLWFEATREGTYQAYCTEYCGTSHSGMLATIEVISEEKYEQFLTQGLGPPEGVSDEEWGKQLYTQNQCVTCHTLDGSKLVGPSFKGLFGRSEPLADGTTVSVDENYIRESILEPQAKIVKGFTPSMPTFQGLLQDRQIDAIIAFMKTVK